MNENCKYCKTAKTCLENAEYNSIYCQIHKRIPKVNDKTYDELQQENQQLKKQLQQKEDIINKANKYVINHLKQDMLSDFTGANYIQEYIEEPDGLLEILDNKG